MSSKRQARRYVEGKKITLAATLRLFEQMKGRKATETEKQEMQEAWNKRMRPSPANGGSNHV